MTNVAISPSDSGRARLCITARGTVQGVGFRPFVYRLATNLGLAGFVLNTPAGVLVEVEGARPALEAFLDALSNERPASVAQVMLESVWGAPSGAEGFEIRASETTGERTVLILPDLATCDACLADLRDPGDRRYRYPFTNCTHCGPRFSIIQKIPYDRPHTTMARFPMCAACAAEYHDPRDRRFHAQPTACPRCGPHLELLTPAGQRQAARDEALLAAAAAVRDGQIVAIKGLGGFHLVVDACSEEAVRRLRHAKRREEKPLALMAPGIGWVRAACHVSAVEARLLQSPQAPIVLLTRRDARTDVAPGVAPGNPNLGVMLPYTPLHHLLLEALASPLVATSGNRSDEPICTDEDEALTRLAGLADLFLVHDRPIARPIDDSVVSVVAGEELVLRRARGYAPLPVTVSRPRASVLAVGAHLKATVALALGQDVVLSQHIGDLETPEAQAAHRRATADLPCLYERTPTVWACDAHPDYASTRLAAESGQRVIAVQHHHAHVVACAAENGVEGRVLGVAWDGTGYGPDGTVWGGEFLVADAARFERVAHLRPFRLPGGESAVREPRRSAVGLLHALWGEDALGHDELPPVRAFAPHARRLLGQALTRGLNAPLTSSVGRLFDAVAALCGLRQVASFEGQAAMELEWALAGVQTDEVYPFELVDGGPPGAAVVEWRALIEALLADGRAGVPIGFLSARFHNTLVEMIVAVARRFRQRHVALSGGCFQNRYLTERALGRLRAEGFEPLRHRLVPPNDGGVALGQVLVAAAQAERS